MSIENRYIKEEGNYEIKYETKFQTFLGKLECKFRGHKEVTIKTENTNLKYCMCCWKEIN